VKADAERAKGERKTGKQTTGSVAKPATDGATSTTSGKPTASTRIDYTATSLGQKLQQNSVQRSKIEAKLKAAGYNGTIYEAAYGFKNLGQFVAAVNVSNNLDIPFRQLKTKMVDDGMSLGQSIKTLRPESSAAVEANRAEYDARGMILESETTTVSATVSASTTTSTTTPTTTTPPKKGKRHGNGSHE
jgi:hypothetical protein